MSTPAAITYAVCLWAVLIIGPVTVTALTKQWLHLVAGILTVGTVWWISALRLGRPDSWWARRFFGPEKMARAIARYSTVVPTA